jgi:sulfopyruvate decarboxylase subunit beta
MQRIDAIRLIAGGDGLIIANLGYPARELHAVADRAEHFYMLGSMGMASSIGLGLALCQQKRVYVIDGDGSVLMNPGSLVTIAHNAPDNLCLVIINNRVYGSTGNQPTYAARHADLAMMARAAGATVVETVDTVESLQAALTHHCTQAVIIIVDVDPGNASVPVIAVGPEDIKKRFMRAVRT